WNNPAGVCPGARNGPLSRRVAGVVGRHARQRRRLHVRRRALTAFADADRALAMNMLLVITRFLHLLATIVVFGGLAFAVTVAIPTLRADAQGKALAWDRLWRRIYSLVHWGLGVSVVSALAWFVLEAALVSGSALAHLLKDDIVARVATQTLFGRVW